MARIVHVDPDGVVVRLTGWTALAAFMRDCLKVLGTEIRHEAAPAAAAATAAE